jgi:hypothetical protein
MTKDRKEGAVEATAAKTYEKPEVKTLEQKDLLTAVNKGSKFPARGYAG